MERAANFSSMEAFLFALLTLTLLVNRSFCQDLQIHFYNTSCPQAEIVAKNLSTQFFTADPSLPAGLLRLQFHDCWTRGCDGSVLIDSTEQNIAEKEAPPNLTLRGFEVIDAIKAALEKECQGIVSCADILAMATRDGCAFAGGSAYDLKTGRRDGTISIMSEVNMPGPSFSVSDALANFVAKGFDLDDLITLLGGHSMGFAHCGFFLDRLYNFEGSGQPDPTISPNTLQTLLNACPQSLESNTNVSLDPKVFINQDTSTPFKLDSSFYQAVLAAEAVLQLDQELAFSNSTLTVVNDYVAKPDNFRKKFAKAIIKLSEVQVNTGQEGEIRLNCRVVNPVGSPNSAPSPAPLPN